MSDCGRIYTALFTKEKEKKNKKSGLISIDKFLVYVWFEFWSSQN
jgi:hypothetical protein